MINECKQKLKQVFQKHCLENTLSTTINNPKFNIYKHRSEEEQENLLVQ